MDRIRLSTRDIATILHALRCLQEIRSPVHGGCVDSEHDGCGMCGHFEDWSALSEEEIDSLSVSLNRLIVLPDDGKCEGCGGPLGGRAFETDDMVIVCRDCWDLCVEENDAD